MMAKRNRKSRKTNRSRNSAAVPVQPRAQALPASPQSDAGASEPQAAAVAEQPAVVERQQSELDAVRVSRVVEVGERPTPEGGKAVAATVEPPVQEARAEEPAVADAAHAPAPQREKARAAGQALDGGPDGRAPSAALDDVAEAFFRAGVEAEEAPRALQESFPPVSEDLSVEAAKSRPLSSAVLARRTKFRRVVGGIVALSALLVLGGIGRSLFPLDPASAATGEKASAQVEAAVTPMAPAVEHSVAVEQAAEPAVEPSVAPEPAHEEPATALPEASEVEASEVEASEVEASEPAAPAPAPSAAAPEASAKLPAEANPRAAALRMLNRGKMKDALPLAQAAIHAEPSHALPYLYLGTALQELGRGSEARDAYDACVRNATKGPIGECRAMGGRK